MLIRKCNTYLYLLNNNLMLNYYKFRNHGIAFDDNIKLNINRLLFNRYLLIFIAIST